MVELKQLLVPIALFSFIAIVALIALSLLFQYLKRRLALETIKQLIMSNREVDAALIETIVKEKRHPYSDLRKGLLLMALTLATAILAILCIQFDLATLGYGLLGMASLPLLIGITYLVFHFLSLNQAE